MSVPTATCPSCRRAVTPVKGALGPSCGLCGGFLPRAKLPARRKPSVPASPVSRAEVAGEVAEQLLEEFGSRCSTVAEFAALHAAVTDVVAEAEAEDVERAARRESAQHWRRSWPEIAELLGG